MSVRLGELLLREKLISPEQLQEALDRQKKSGGKLGKVLVALGFVRDEHITTLLSRQYGVPSINLDHFEVDPRIIKTIPAETARKYQVLPLSRSGRTLTIAMADPTNVFAMDDIKFMTGYNIEPVVASESAVEDSIERYYGASARLRSAHAAAPAGTPDPLPGAGPTVTVDDLAAIGALSDIDVDSIAWAGADAGAVDSLEDEIDLGNLAKDADAAPVVKLVNVLLLDALKRGASDIHVEPYDREFRVRFRIDGVLYNVMALPPTLRDPLTQRIKLMARLNPAQKRLCQNGHIKIRLKVADRSRELDYRVSVRPTQWGDTIVLRVLDRSRLILDMTRLGFEPLSLRRFRSGLARGRGLVLVAGPQRSGKTTTLYSALAALNVADRNVVTVEDPVEFDLPGANQISLNRAAGESAAAVLRSLAHADADAIAVSEIGDAERGSLALDLALGHLVLSTLAAEDAPSAVARLLSMDVDPYVLATTTNVIVAQRLVRRICTKCRVDVTAEVASDTLVETGFAPEDLAGLRVAGGRGCAGCNGTGYSGQVGLYEVMEFSGAIRYLITVGASPMEMLRKAIEEGMITLRMSGLEKIRAGVTTIEEVLRETVLGPGFVVSRAASSEAAPEEHGVGRRAGAPTEREDGTAPTRGPEVESPAVVREIEALVGNSREELATRLEGANAEIAELRLRLLELSCSDILVVQLANAKAEIEALRERLFELHSYRTAYERLLSSRPFPRAGNA